MLNQTPFPSDSDLLTPGSKIGLMVWRASSPSDNDVWLSVKNNRIALFLVENKKLKAEVRFQANPKTTSFADFSEALDVSMKGQIFDSTEEKTFNPLASDTDRLERLLWLARSNAADGDQAISLGSEAIEEIWLYGRLEWHASQMARKVEKLAETIFGEKSALVLPKAQFLSLARP